MSERSVNRLLHALGYSLQANRKTLEGRQHSDRDGQFRYIDERVREFQGAGQPVVSVDTKKKENLGQYRNGGREWRPEGQPEEVNVYDFPDAERGKAIPYGVYDVAANAGWVSLGLDHDTLEFAVETLAGVLMCTPEPQRWMRAAYIQAVQYAGLQEDEHYQIDARDIEGPLDAQVGEAFDFVRRNMRIRAFKRLGRAEVPEYSEKAIFEALVNAVAHQDYCIAGSRIRLHMFADRIELSVPGGLAKTLTPDVLHLRKATRNPLIASLLARSPARPEFPRQMLMDERGNGVPRILNETQRLTGRLPKYSLLGDSELRLVLPAADPF